MTEKLEEMGEFFNTRADHYDVSHVSCLDGGAESKRLIASFLPEGSRKVIDLGVGTGLELEEMFRLFPGIEVTGLDIAGDMMKKLKEKYPDKNITLFKASYLKFDFGLNRYDAAVSVMTLHHYGHDVKTALYRWLHSALKEGGVYIEGDYMLSEYEYDDPQAEENFRFAEYERLKREQSLPDARAYHYDTPCTVNNQKEMLRKAGFTNVREVWRCRNNVILRAEK